MKPHARMLAAACATFTTTCATFIGAGNAFADQGNPGIAPIDSRIAPQATYVELGAQWWQWALQAGATDNPLTDTTGEHCRVGQRGPVWFLAGTFFSSDVTARSCTVPGGKALFFPVLNVFAGAFLNDSPDTRTPQYLRNQIDELCTDESIADVSVTIDGAPVSDPTQYFTASARSTLFEIQLPGDNVFGLTTSDAVGLLLSPTVQKGLYLYVKPLAAGVHTVHWEGRWSCGSQHVTYTLDVLPGVQ